MCPPCHDKHQHRADNGSYDNRQQLGLDEVEIEHEGYAWRHEEEAHIGDEEIGHPLHPLQLNGFHLQQDGQQHHPNDATWDGDTCQPHNQLTYSETRKDNEALSNHAALSFARHFLFVCLNRRNEIFADENVVLEVEVVEDGTEGKRLGFFEESEALKVLSVVFVLT